MLRIFNNNGAVNMEHSIEISEDTAKVVSEILKKKELKPRIKAISKDLHVEVRIEEKDGQFFSVAGRTMSDSFDVQAEERELIGAHEAFAQAIGDIKEELYPKEKADEEEDNFLLHAGLCALDQVAKHFGGAIVIIAPNED